MNKGILGCRLIFVVYLRISTRFCKQNLFFWWLKSMELPLVYWLLTHVPLLQDLFSALIKGPTRTPYEDGLFLFDIQLPNIYPAVPPLFRYLSQCSGRLNPNLYDNGKVCVSLLGTWIGKVSHSIPAFSGFFSGLCSSAVFKHALVSSRNVLHLHNSSVY